MNEEENLSWSVLEYEEKYRSGDWFWALGVVAITCAITAIIYNNYFFAVLILLSGGLLYFFAKKSPDLVDYEINKKGFKVKSQIHPYKNIKSFYVQKEGKTILFVKTERFFLPIISVTIDHDLADRIENIFLENNVIEEIMKEHPSEKIMETLGF